MQEMLSLLHNPETLRRHSCAGNNRLKFPAKTERIQFQNFGDITKSTFVLYVDLETFSAPSQHKEENCTKTKSLIAITHRLTVYIASVRPKNFRTRNRTFA